VYRLLDPVGLEDVTVKGKTLTAAARSESVVLVRGYVDINRVEYYVNGRVVLGDNGPEFEHGLYIDRADLDGDVTPSAKTTARALLLEAGAAYIAANPDKMARAAYIVWNNQMVAAYEAVKAARAALDEAQQAAAALLKQRPNGRA
jgi:hypothetical protein